MTVIVGVDPHEATHVAVAIDGDERPTGRLEVIGTAVRPTHCWRGRRRWETIGRGRLSPRTRSGSCCRSSSSRRARTVPWRLGTRSDRAEMCGCTQTGRSCGATLIGFLKQDGALRLR